MIQDIKFQGLSSSPSDNSVQDGELGTCLNLIPEDGELKPMQQPIVVEDFKLSEDEDIVYVHKVTHNEELHSHYIIHSTKDNKWFWIEKNSTDKTKTTIDIPSDFVVNAVTSIGNILCFVGNEKTIYSYWIKGKYTIFDLTKLDYNIVVNTEDTYFGDTQIASTLLTDNFENAFEYIKGHLNRYVPTNKTAGIVFPALDAIINKKLTELGNEYFKYYSLCVVALKLYDGSFINISNPFFLMPSILSHRFIYTESSKGIGIDYSVQKHSLTLNFEIKEELKEIIVGASVFLSAPETFFDLNKTPENVIQENCIIWKDGMKDDVRSAAFAFKSEKAIYETVESMTFYHCKDIELEDLGKEIALERIKETETTIPLADFKKSTYGGNCAITYNNRLHIADVTKSSVNPYKSFCKRKWNKARMNEKPTSALKDLTIANFAANSPIDISLENKGTTNYECDCVYIVKLSSTLTEKTIYNSGKIQYPINPILTYPSADAKEMTILFCHSQLGKYYKKTFALKKSDSFGMSYYIHLGNKVLDYANQEKRGENVPDDYLTTLWDNTIPTYIQLLDYKLLKKTWTSSGHLGNNDPVEYTYYEWDETSIDTKEFTEITKEEYDAALSKCSDENQITHSPSLIKVSEAENPLVFPASNSVQVGSSVIKAMAANTRPITEGQFGDAPLYVFTDEGTWMLMLSADGKYQARQPVNRDVCSNPKGILQIDDAVLFPTERGIMMQTGSTSKLITDVLDGTVFDYTQLYKEEYSKKILAVRDIPEGAIKYVPFRQFMQNADMVYDYYDGRIIVFNPSCRYAYVYSLKSGLWGTMESDIKKRINIYPESYAINGHNQIVDFYQSQPTDAVTYFLCTRPMSISGAEVYKTMFSCITRGYFRNEPGKCGMALYGSNDLFRWFPISTSVNKYLRGMCGSPYKYFRLALIGSLLPEERLNGLSADFQERWQNKLR